MSDSAKVAFITGGSKGIGYGIAEVLIKNGIRAAVTSRSQENADGAAEKLNRIKDGYALGIESDVRNLDSQLNGAKKVAEKWGGIDYYIANAGVGHFGSIEELTDSQWKETIDINLTGVFNSAKAAVSHLKKSKGYFITIASLAGTNFFAGGAAYNASKFGLVGFTQAMMLDLRHKGVKVTTIMPGSVSTYFNGNEPSAKDAWKIQPEDIGQIVLDIIQIPARTLPSKIEVRPSKPPKK